MTLWLKVTNDKYELPLIVADSAKELAEQLGKRTNNIYSAISKARRRGKNPVYRKVVVEDED